MCREVVVIDTLHLFILTWVPGFENTRFRLSDKISL